MRINISPLNSHVLKDASGPVIADRFSNADLAQSFLRLANFSIITPILPSNCIQYIRKNHSYIITQEFDPIITDVSYTISEGDIMSDMYWYRDHYVARCRARASNCRACTQDCDATHCCEYSNCYHCNYTDEIRETIDGYCIDDEVIFQKVPVPRTLFVSVLGIQGDQYFMRKCFVKALIDPITNYSSPVFNIPFGNLFDDSSICWGDNDFDPSSNLIFVSGVLSRFFGASFNADLDDRIPQSNLLGKSFNLKYFSTKNFLNIVQQQPRFDTEWLLLFNQNHTADTYGDFIDRIIETHTT